MGLRQYKGNDWTETGWAIVDRQSIVVTTVAGMALPVREGVAGQVLAAWARWFHENVERLDQYFPLDDWGWSFDNAVADSNHLGGVALDLNATEHPFHTKASDTFTPDQIAAIRRGQRLFEDFIFWGEDWTNSRDPMHFQLATGSANGKLFTPGSGVGPSPALADFAARKIRGGYLIEGPPDIDLSADLLIGFAQLGPAGRPL